MGWQEAIIESAPCGVAGDVDRSPGSTDVHQRAEHSV